MKEHSYRNGRGCYIFFTSKRLNVGWIFVTAQCRISSTLFRVGQYFDFPLPSSSWEIERTRWISVSLRQACSLNSEFQVNQSYLMYLVSKQINKYQFYNCQSCSQKYIIQNGRSMLRAIPEVLEMLSQSMSKFIYYFVMDVHVWVLISPTHHTQWLS